jgi:hypothetical protein
MVTNGRRVPSERVEAIPSSWASADPAQIGLAPLPGHRCDTFLDHLVATILP